MQSLLQHYLEEYKRVTVPSSELWNEARKTALQKLTEEGWPTIQDESWRYSAGLPWLQRPFTIYLPDSLAISTINSLAPNAHANLRIFCINGCLQLPANTSLPAGLQIQSVYPVMADDPALLTKEPFSKAHHLGGAFAALNTLFAKAGIYIKVLQGYNNIPLIEIHYVFTRQFLDAQSTMLCIRNAIEVGTNSTLKCIEYISTIEEDTDQLSVPSCINTLATAVLHPRAQFSWAQSLKVPDQTVYVGQLAVQQDKDSLFQAESLAEGGGFARQTIFVDLKGRGASCELLGLSGVKQQQVIDHQMVVTHQADDTQSNIHYRGIADDSGRLVFSGEVRAEVGVHKMKSHQTNHSLLLSNQAEINTKPRLRLFSDDLQCTHGATVGDLDASALFYLQSRGIAVSTARRMLTQAFSEVIWKVMRLLPSTNQPLFTNFLGLTALKTD